MKNFLCLLVAIVLLTSFKNGYKVNEGIMTLQFTYPDSTTVGENRLASYPKQILIYFKNGYTRAEYKNPINKYNTITIINGETQQGYSSYGSDMILQSTKLDRFREAELTFPGYSIQTMNETKIIAGFKCLKAIVTYTPIGGTERTIDIWYTNELDVNPIEMDFNGINGFIMEYSFTDMIYANPAAINFRKFMTCVKVEQTTVSPMLFKRF